MFHMPQLLSHGHLNIRIISAPLKYKFSYEAEYISKTSLYKSREENFANITCRPRPTSLTSLHEIIRMNDILIKAVALCQGYNRTG